MISFMRLETLTGAQETATPDLKAGLDACSSLDGNQSLEVWFQHKNGRKLFVLGGHDGGHVIELTTAQEDLRASLDVYTDGFFSPIPREDESFSLKYRMTGEQVAVAVEDFLKTGEPTGRLTWESFKKPLDQDSI